MTPELLELAYQEYMARDISRRMEWSAHVVDAAAQSGTDLRDLEWACWVKSQEEGK